VAGFWAALKLSLVGTLPFRCVKLLKNGVMAVLCEPGCEKMKLCLSVSFVLVKGGRVGTGLRGLQGVWHVVQECFEGCYVCENVGEGSVQPCLVIFFEESCGGVCKHDGRLLTQSERVPCCLVACGKGESQKKNQNQKKKKGYVEC